MIPLPQPREITSLLDFPTISDAYRTVLTLENSILTDPDQRKLIHARILGYLLLYGPSLYARESVAREVASCEGDDVLLEAGKFYYDYFILAFRKPIGSSSGQTSRSDSWNQSLEETDDIMSRKSVGVPQSHGDAKQNALIRDGFRCVISGNYDRSCVFRSSELENKLHASSKSVTSTHCVHIFPELVSMNVVGDKSFSTPSIWDIMNRFGYPNIYSELNGGNIHRLQNAITMCSDACDKFERLYLWLEATDIPNTYALQARDELYFFKDYRRTVSFTTPDEVKYPLPSSDYLAIHASCAKIAYLSGAGHYIDVIEWELEDSATLEEDGSSAEALDHAIAPLSR
ncbi:hypothetical protein BDN70DRAFT_936954 [Pholiota conissans]|uniref:HNH nuclease domain-containing protein n=1 Tax=Pholiota conissans TaxID=109636 RepID=A0A9P6CPK7_9AGAR|nr:hypothetical protein BDN70DRAFT_936954 [Pholiota conissans]